MSNLRIVKNIKMCHCQISEYCHCQCLLLNLGECFFSSNIVTALPNILMSFIPRSVGTTRLYSPYFGSTFRKKNVITFKANLFLFYN